MERLNLEEMVFGEVLFHLSFYFPVSPSLSPFLFLHHRLRSHIQTEFPQTAFPQTDSITTYRQQPHRQTAFLQTDCAPTHRQRSHRQTAFPQTNSVPRDSAFTQAVFPQTDCVPTHRQIMFPQTFRVTTDIINLHRQHTHS